MKPRALVPIRRFIPETIKKINHSTFKVRATTKNKNNEPSSREIYTNNNEVSLVDYHMEKYIKESINFISEINYVIQYG